MAEQLDYAEKVIAMTARLLKRQNHHREMTILVKAKPTITWVERESNIDFGELYLYIPIDLYEQVERDREDLQSRIRQLANGLVRGRNEHFTDVYLTPHFDDVSANWREEITTLSDSQFGIPPTDSQYEADIFMLMPFKDKRERKSIETTL